MISIDIEITHCRAQILDISYSLLHLNVFLECLMCNHKHNLHISPLNAMLHNFPGTSLLTTGLVKSLLTTGLVKSLHLSLNTDLPFKGGYSDLLM